MSINDFDKNVSPFDFHAIHSLVSHKTLMNWKEIRLDSFIWKSRENAVSWERIQILIHELFSRIVNVNEI